MPGKANDLTDQTDGLCQPLIVQVKAQFFDPFGIGPAIRHAPDLAGKSRCHILGKPHDLADLADCGARPEMNDRGAESGAVAAIPLIDPLDHLLATFMFEIHVYIRWLAPVFRDETLEHHGDLIRSHIGYAQKVTQDRIGGRTAPLTENADGARILHDVMD